MMKWAAANDEQVGADAWKEGGANRALMHGAGATLMTGIAGDNAVDGAAGAAIALATGAGAVAGGESEAFLDTTLIGLIGRIMRKNDLATKKKNFVTQVCRAGAQCSDVVLQAAIQAQIANGDATAAGLQLNYAIVNGSALSVNGKFSVNLYDG